MEHYAFATIISREKANANKLDVVAFDIVTMAPAQIHGIQSLPHLPYKAVFSPMGVFNVLDVIGVVDPFEKDAMSEVTAQLQMVINHFCEAQNFNGLYNLDTGQWEHRHVEADGPVVATAAH